MSPSRKWVPGLVGLTDTRAGHKVPLLPTGSNRKRDLRNVRVKKPDYKVAYVQLVGELVVTDSDPGGGGGGVFVQPARPGPGARKALRGRVSRSTELCSNPQ